MNERLPESPPSREVQHLKRALEGTEPSEAPLKIIFKRYALAFFASWFILSFIVTGTRPFLGALLMPVLIMLAWNKFIIPSKNAKVDARNKARLECNHPIWDQSPSVEVAHGENANSRNVFIRGWFPDAYLSTDHISGVFRVINERRAGSFTEAINVHVQDLRHMEMKMLSAAQLNTAAVNQAANTRRKLDVTVHHTG